MKATTEDWGEIERSAKVGGLIGPHCLLDLRDILAALTARVEALEAQAAQPAHKPAMTAQPGEHPDTRRLRWLMENGAVEGFSHVAQDRYELAAECAAARDRDEPNADDEFSGFRLLIDLAMTIDAASAQPAQAEQGQGPERGQEAEPLVKRMHHAWRTHRTWAAEIDAVADWLAAGHPTFATAANALRAEARCTREGRRG